MKDNIYIYNKINNFLDGISPANVLAKFIETIVRFAPLREIEGPSKTSTGTQKPLLFRSWMCVQKFRAQNRAPASRKVAPAGRGHGGVAAPRSIDIDSTWERSTEAARTPGFPSPQKKLPNGKRNNLPRTKS